jgi:hypothetical protein
MPKSKSDIDRKIIAKLRLPSAIRFCVYAGSRLVHGRTMLRPRRLQAFLDRSDLLDMRVATFLAEYAVMIGAQVGGPVRLELLGHAIDGRVAMRSLAAA